MSSLSGNEFKRVDGKTLTEQVAEYFETIGGKAMSPIYGEVILDEKGAEDSLSHGIGRNKAIAYTAVKDVIENGVLIDYDKNHKGRDYDSALIAAPITIGGERYVCEVVITRKQDNRFYLHEVTSVKKLQDAVSLTNSGQSPTAHQGVIAKVLQNIISTSDNVSKVVDENGKPMVVYHGSPYANSKENDDIRFSSDNLTQEKLTEQSKGLSEEAAETQISELSDKMKTKVHYVRNEVITGNTPTNRKKRRSKGWYQNGKVYINLSNHETVQDAVETFLFAEAGRSNLPAFFVSILKRCKPCVCPHIEQYINLFSPI